MAKQRLSALQKAEQKRKRNTIIIGVLLVFLMISSVLGYVYSPNQENPADVLQYNDYKFRVQVTEDGQSQVVVTKINGQDVFFYNLPYQLEGREFPQEFKDALVKANTIQFTTEPLGLDEAATQDRLLMQLLVNHFNAFSGKQGTQGVLEKSIYEERPLITCEDSASFSPVILLSYKNASALPKVSTVEGYSSCFMLEAQGIGILEARDYMIYYMNGVLN